jgi:hypothetical protein
MVVQLLPGPFTVADYYRMAERGILRPDQRVELIDGQIVPMNPIASRHAGCVIRLNDLLAPPLAGLASVSIQNPVRLHERAEPQPDVALLRPRGKAYGQAHPQPPDVLLVIEVSDSSLDYDREVKVPLYARAGIPEVWVVDLEGERIHVLTQPVAGSYARVREVSHGDVIVPLLLPQVSLRVDDVLG